MADLLQNTDRGLYCAAGDFYVDPWRAVPRAVITHAHSDHARWGSEHYLCAERGVGVLRERLGKSISVQGARFGETVSLNGVKVSLHPAGHILGSAQIRIEHAGEVWVVSGDYKIEADRTCDAFEPVRCHCFITESTFGLPVYRWRPQSEVFTEINNWWRRNQESGCTSVLYAYSLGKAQRLLGGIDPSLGPIFIHGSVEKLLPSYREAGIALPETQPVSVETIHAAAGRGLVVAPQSVADSPWLRRFGDISTAFASGWMQIRGARRRESLDRGFILSDHADWPGLHEAIRATGARRILVTHGYTGVMVRYLREQGFEADALETRFTGDRLDETDPSPPRPPSPSRSHGEEENEAEKEERP